MMHIAVCGIKLCWLENIIQLKIQNLTVQYGSTSKDYSQENAEVISEASFHYSIQQMNPVSIFLSLYKSGISLFD